MPAHRKDAVKRRRRQGRGLESQLHPERTRGILAKPAGDTSVELHQVQAELPVLALGLRRVQGASEPHLVGTAANDFIVRELGFSQHFKGLREWNESAEQVHTVARG